MSFLPVYLILLSTFFIVGFTHGLSQVKTGSRRGCYWWQFWDPQSGFIGGVLGAAILIPVAMIVSRII